MPNWKKVIVSGSDASLNSLSVTTNITATSFTGSLFGTASWANNAVTASYITTAQTASYVLNAVSASFVSTASSADNFLVRGTLTAQSFSSGSVIFAGANGILSQSNSNFFWDNTNGRLGIGTITPSNPLQVNGAVRATSLIGSTSATIGGTSAANASAVIDLISTTKGLLPPRTDLTSNIATPVQGLITYLTGSTNEGLYYYSSGSIKAWTKILNNTGSQIISGSLDVTGDIVAYSTSDARFKSNISPILDPLYKLNQIRGVEFNWLENSEYHGFKGHDIGVIAQEIEKVLPEVVTTRDNGYKAVKYEKIIPLLIEAIKAQQSQINDLKEIIKNK